MRRFLIMFISCLMVCQSVMAQALPVSKMQSLISGVIQQKSLKRGFAANDPRYGRTLVQTSDTIAGVAGGTAGVITAGAITAPAWVTVAVGVGVAVVVTYGVAVGLNGLVKWLFKLTGIDELGQNADIDKSNGIAPGSEFWCGSDRINQLCGGDPYAIGFQAHFNIQIRGGNQNPSTPTCNPGEGGASVTCGSIYVAKQNNVNRTCAKGQYWGGTGCSAYSYTMPPYGSTSTNTNVSPQTAVDHLTVQERALALNPEIGAAVANKAWQDAAAKPGYDGLPYTAADPITPAEVAQWKQANPTRYPTVGDFVAPQPAANQPWKLPINPAADTQQATDSPAPGTNPAQGQPLVNLGPDPGIGAPTLEATPTPVEILQPIFDLMPGFKNFAVPSHSGQCPMPQFDVFGEQIVMRSHCDISEDNRASIAAIMAAVWALCAAFIVLRA